MGYASGGWYGLEKHLAKLQHFQFTFDNPVFWTAMLVLFLLLLRLWNMRKSFSFCFVITIVLLSATKAEQMIARALFRAGGDFDPLLIRIGVVALIVFITVYYSIIRTD